MINLQVVDGDGAEIVTAESRAGPASRSRSRGKTQRGEKTTGKREVPSSSLSSRSSILPNRCHDR
eukprot:10498226-Prorocentrum_lima.AAC.1